MECILKSLFFERKSNAFHKQKLTFLFANLSAAAMSSPKFSFWSLAWSNANYK